jgi:putative transposase
VNELAPVAGRKRACEALGRSRASHYRSLRPQRRATGHIRQPSTRALSADERQHVVDVLDSEEFCDLAPRQVWARLLDAGTYLCSVPQMYRLLAERGEVRERRRQARHPATRQAELVATEPNQVWS